MKDYGCTDSNLRMKNKRNYREYQEFDKREKQIGTTRLNFITKYRNILFRFPKENIAINFKRLVSLAV
jgi:hypothetical protein